MRSSTVALKLLSDSVARGSPVSLTHQLRAAIEVGVLSGELEHASRLPSVRELSVVIGVAPGTVARAYQELVAEGLVDCRERTGFFVKMVARVPPAETDFSQRIQLVSLIDEAVRLAVDMTPEEFIGMVRAQFQRTRASPRRVAVLGYRDVALAERVAIVADALRDLAVDVVGVPYEELIPGPRTADLPTADVYLVPVLEHEIAATLLGAHASHIVPMTRRVRRDIVDSISSLPPATQFAVIHTNRNTVARTLIQLRRMHPLERQPVLASIDEPEKVADAIRRADAILVGPHVRAQLADFGPIHVPVISLVYVPDQRTLGELRSKLAATSRGISTDSSTGTPEGYGSNGNRTRALT